MRKGRIFVVSGPSASGKTTLLESLLKSKELKKRLVKSISFTTRPKRSGEKDGRDYCFISERDFLEKRRENKLLEWTKYLGFYYGTPKDFIERQLKKNKSVILCLDLKGALKIRRLYPQNTTTVFILPPSLAALRERIEKRSQKNKREEVSHRINLAKKELLAAAKYDYCVVNKNFLPAVRGLKDVILSKINV